MDDNRLHVITVQSRLIQVIADLSARAQRHDASKFVSPEREGYERLHVELTPIVYGSPEYKAKMAEFRWLLDHHFAENDHHPEHEPDGVNGMTLMSVIEMLADWKAASERPQSTSTLAKGLKWNFERFGIDRQLAGIILNTAVALGWVTLGECIDSGLTE
jgi:hypothetical protein